MRESYDIDLLVIGQGFAGSAVAMAAVDAGLSVHVVEKDTQSGRTASRIAAGLITPLTGKKINPGWRLEELLPLARKFYHSAEALLGKAIFYECAIHRWFVDECEAEAFAARRNDPRIARWVGADLPADPRVRAPFGGFAMVGGARLDPNSWLEGVSSWLGQRSAISHTTVPESAIICRHDGIEWAGYSARWAILCQGLAAVDGGYFPGLPFRPASGEVLEITVDGGAPAEVWNSGGKWIAPTPDGVCLCGATYGFGEWLPRVRAEGVAELTHHLDSLLRVPYQVRAIRSGVRPILHQSRPVAGFHAQYPRLGFLNGLGSKGVLTAPWAARQLIAACLDGAPLDRELQALFSGPKSLNQLNQKSQPR